MIKRLDFFPKYTGMLTREEKTATTRIGDKSSNYRVGDKIEITINHQERINTGIITAAIVKDFGGIKE
jgi:hypothetical protein